MKEIQKSKEYNSKTGKYEMMSFKQDKKGKVSVSPVKKKMAKKMYKGAGDSKFHSKELAEQNKKIHATYYK